MLHFFAGPTPAVTFFPLLFFLAKTVTFFFYFFPVTFFLSTLLLKYWIQRMCGKFTKQYIYKHSRMLFVIICFPGGTLEKRCCCGLDCVVSPTKPHTLPDSRLSGYLASCVMDSRSALFHLMVQAVVLCSVTSDIHIVAMSVSWKMARKNLERFRQCINIIFRHGVMHALLSTYMLALMTWWNSPKDRI